MILETITSATDWQSIPDEVASVRVIFGAGAKVYFLPLLQEGLWVRCGLEGSLKEVLCGPLCIDSEYLANRISTLFLNGQPVDDLDAARVRPGDVIALSAAMPGLVGAVMRRGGYFSGLRNSITCRPASFRNTSGDGFVRIKLFNKIMLELGPAFLDRGFYLPGTRLRELLANRVEDRSGAEATCRVAEQTLTLPEMLAQLPDDWLFFQLGFNPSL